MFYRRKIILALLGLFGGQLDKIRLQKLLFLFTLKQSKPEYDFIPYKFGCYSYSANADMTAMAAKGILKESSKDFSKMDKNNYLNQLKADDRKYMQEIKVAYGKMSATAIMKYIYLNYPFYAIKSEAFKKILNKKEFQKVLKAVPHENKTILFTIGYEGISPEEYLVRLLQNDIKLLVDVRRNPLSMKFGFSKSRLKKYCESVGIQYMHFPELGIQPEQRQELKSQADYDSLFEFYRKNNLPKTLKTQLEILNLLKQYKRIALTCYESDISRCHRKHLANAIEELPSFNYELKHI